ncbi:hypothetical protein XENTR_v10018091 [Xenopus tropicalis]|uniref:Uncharacterized protein C10orf95 homolog n=1 Tax=Xenopus tropicalis TaxID=8364 RepID=A0A8J0SRY8_XENTR|nr:uncharacterized protein C10orf95 homolog [Xenopus tropicalis]KAE8590514.1 hypothetical protein XENTR_v10018091 [Xenopus tropicalis]|eukprot:XP_012823225.1 PREDICTED: uncharacterized protein LOC105948016 [Xenopus tropicalis]
MYHYGFSPPFYRTMMFMHPNAYMPYTMGRFQDAPAGFVLPPIQMHNFSSRPSPLFGGQMYYPQEFTNGQREYHHFYGVNPYYSLPNWYYPRVSAVPPYNHNYNNKQTHIKLNGWPEGFTMKGELHWGKLERVFGMKRELPEFVKDDLRRVYGTYPRTFVTITYQNGEFLVKGDPKVGEQEYTVEKKVVRKAPTPTDSEDDISEVKQSKKKRKGKR